MDNLWIIHGLSMDTHGLSMENPWISMDYPWISGNHFRHQMARHSSWEDFNQTNLDDFPVRIFAIFEIARFPLFIFLNLCIFSFILGGTVDHQGSVWGQLGPPRIILEAFCLSVAFPEIGKSENHENRVLNVSRESVRRNSRESMRNRCPVIFQPSVYSKTMFFIDFIMVG